MCIPTNDTPECTAGISLTKSNRAILSLFSSSKRLSSSCAASHFPISLLQSYGAHCGADTGMQRLHFCKALLLLLLLQLLQVLRDHRVPSQVRGVHRTPGKKGTDASNIVTGSNVCHNSLWRSKQELHLYKGGSVYKCTGHLYTDPPLYKYIRGTQLMSKQASDCCTSSSATLLSLMPPFALDDVEPMGLTFLWT